MLARSLMQLACLEGFIKVLHMTGRNASANCFAFALYLLSLQFRQQKKNQGSLDQVWPSNEI